MSGDNGKSVDWQAELKARLEAYEKRTGRKLSGKRSEEKTEEKAGEGPEEYNADTAGQVTPEESKVASSPETTHPGPDTGKTDSDGADEDSDEEYDYPAGPDFLAILDGVDDEDDEDSFLFKERLSRDTDPDEEDIFDNPLEGGATSPEEPYFTDFEEEPPVVDSPEADHLDGEPLVKVVNIDEFRMDSSTEEVIVPLESDIPPLLEPEEEPEDEEVPKEIIVSRLLGATLDMVLAVVLAAGFMEMAAWKLSLDFFSLGILKWIGLLSLFFYFFNCLYFLSLIHRTPGMLLTELKLRSSRKSRDITFLPVLVRTLAFFPSALSVTGLVWSFFDHQARCLHDIVSGTRVVSNKGGR